MCHVFPVQRALKSFEASEPILLIRGSWVLSSLGGGECVLATRRNLCPMTFSVLTYGCQGVGWLPFRSRLADLLKRKHLQVGTLDTWVESMVSESLGSVCSWPDWARQVKFQGAVRVENPIIRGRHYGGSNHLG